MNLATHPLKPIAEKDSVILILGSFPSLKSFEQMFYYGHPKNLFWRLLGEIYGAKTDTKEEKIELLKNAKIALWDVVASCERSNSADSNLKNINPNDIKGLLESYPNIKTVFFTGKTAEKLYKKHFSDVNLPTVLLPSPSPAYAAIGYEEKLFIWKKILTTKGY